MQLFKRILKQPEPAAETGREERRSTQRFAISPQFPLKAVLSLVGRDDTGAPMSNTRHGWNWKGRLIDCSEHGARIQMGPALKAETGDSCDLKLGVDDFELTVPGRIANIHEQPEGLVFGLKHEFADDAALASYRQLLEVVALGSTLKLSAKVARPDESGYLVETYASKRPARLTVWRNHPGKQVVAFEFQLKDNLVRAAGGHAVEYLTGAEARRATAGQALEIQRLFRWVVANLADAVPHDVRDFLRHYAA